MSNPLVSVVIPTHNRTDKIIRAVESVLNQTYKNIEIIVVDDNSSDDTKLKVENFIQERGLNSLIYKRNDHNLGNAATRNVGIKMARGEYIAFLDDDDLWLPTKIKNQIEIASKQKVKVVYCGTVWQEGDKILKSTFSDNKKVSYEYGGPTSTWLIHRSVFKEIGFFDEKFPSAVDGDFLVRLNKNFKSGFVREFLYIHFYYPEQISSSAEKKIKGFELLLKKYRGIFNRYELSSVSMKLAIYSFFGRVKNFKYLFFSIKKQPNFKNLAILFIFIFPYKMSRFLLNKLLDYYQYPKSFAGRYEVN